MSPRKPITACCLTFGVNTPTSIGVPADMLGAGGSGVASLRGSHGGAGTSGPLVEGGRYTHTHNTTTCQLGRSQTTAITVEHSQKRTWHPDTQSTVMVTQGKTLTQLFFHQTQFYMLARASLLHLLCFLKIYCRHNSWPCFSFSCHISWRNKSVARPAMIQAFFVQ